MALEVVYVVGAPRSGTTWVQRMLGSHPEIAAPQELDLVDGYLAAWDGLWRKQLPGDPDEWRRRRYKGLPAALTEEEFEQLLRDVAGRVYAQVLAAKPGARTLVDKEPLNALRVPLIRRLFPEARFIHVLRDGRDVVASMLRASRSWGSFWAPARADAAAAQWRACVEGARGAGGHEVRYEDLATERGPDLVARMFEVCGVEADRELCERLLSETTPGSSAGLVWSGEVARRVEGVPREPERFAGEGGVGAWRRDLRVGERLAVESVAGGLLRELGYAESGWAGGSAAQRLAARGSRSAGAFAQRVRAVVAR